MMLENKYSELIDDYSRHEYSVGNVVHDKERLQQLQNLSLDRKIMLTQARIIEWYNHFNGNVYVSFSGGKDSTVLAHIVHKLFPEVPLVFSNTGLEYIEIQSFAKQNNAIFVRPKMSFVDVIKNYGYPVVSKEVSEAIYYARKNNALCVAERERERERERVYKRLELLGLRPSESRKSYWENVFITGSLKPNNVDSDHKSIFNKEKWLPLSQMPFLISNYCCNVMKKSPLKKWQTSNNHIVPYIATMASESRVRKQAWLRHGCNAFDGNKKSSQPMSFWTEQDVLEYIYRYNINIADVYGEVTLKNDGVYETTGVDRTGCIFCGFGLHLEKGESRFEKLKQTHPKQYEYCIGGGEWSDNPFYIDGLSQEPDKIGWVAWNPKKIWMPNSKGLGFGKVFDMINEVYGEQFMRY